MGTMGTSGAHPVFDDIERAEAIKGDDIQRLKDLLADADAKLAELNTIEEAVLASFNGGAEPGQKITRASIPEAVQEVLDLLTQAREADEESGDAGNREHVIATLRAGIEAAQNEALRWQQEREAALQTARASRDTADAAVKELKIAQLALAAEQKKTAVAVAEAVVGLDSERKNAGWLDPGEADELRMRTLNEREPLAKAFVAMVNDPAAVLDLTETSQATQDIVNAAMAALDASIPY